MLFRSAVPRNRGDGARVVSVGDGKPQLVEPGARKSLTVDLGKDERTTTITVKSPSGVPEALRVTGLAVREPAGPWISIL